MAGSTYNKDSLTLNIGDVDNSLKITTEFSRMSDTFGFTYDNSIISVTPATITSGDIQTVTLTITALASGTTTLIWNYDSVTYPSNPASVSITVAPSDYKVLVNNSTLQNIADAIRNKNGSSTTYLPSEMATAIDNIPSAQNLTITSGSSTASGGFQIVIETIPSLDISGNSCRYMFADYKGSRIPILNGTSNVTNMSYMFYNCVSVTNFNLDNYDTSNVTTMANMFNCTSAVAIRNLDCSSFNVGKVTNMRSMFSGLFQLAKLDISSFDFSGVTTFSGMFSNCGNYSKQANGAYADGIPYVYVKDATAQNWVLTANNGHPNTWTTNNVIIKNNQE